MVTMDRNQQQAILNDLAAGRLKKLSKVFIFPDHNLVASGEYFDRVNGGEWQQLITLWSMKVLHIC
jgi:hypothetical protein